MRILFQGGWRKGRDPNYTKPLVTAYCRALAKHIVGSKHRLILTSTHEYEQVIAKEVKTQSERLRRDPEEYLAYLLPPRFLPRKISRAPSRVRVETFEEQRWWSQERTVLVDRADAIIAVGGGKGTVDCIEKAFLAHKPVFVACAIQSASSEAWRMHRPPGYHYLVEGDTSFVDDLNITPERFFKTTFRILDALGESRLSQRIFIIHGRDNRSKVDLTKELERLGLQAITLGTVASAGRTVIEKLEDETSDVGFAFVLLTPDDVGGLFARTRQRMKWKPRARQNVILELGFLMGKLDRNRVCLLYTGEVELPSDVEGIVRVQFHRSIREAFPEIVKELKSAGYSLKLQAISPPESLRLL